MGVLYYYYHLFSQNFTGQHDNTNRHRTEVVGYRVGDLVLLSTKDLKWQMIGKQSKKLTEQFMEPYRIKLIISTNIVELELPSTIKISPVVNVSRIK